MISRRSVLVGGGAFAALVGGAELYRVSSLASDIRAPLLYAFGPHEFASRIQILSGQVSGNGLFDPERVKVQYPDWNGEPLINRELHVRELSDPSSRAVTTPNNDTLYTSAVLDLSVGPIELFAPESQDRYVSVAFMDPFNDQVAYIGSRATAGRGGRFWIIGPGQSVDVPEGIEPIRLQSNDVWMLGRVFVAGTQDLEDARSVQSQISVRPVNRSAIAKPFLIRPSERPDAKNFLALTNEILGRNSVAPHTARASQFEDFGILPGELDAFERLSALKKRVWTGAVEQVESRISAQIEALEKTETGWSKPPLILGNYGTNDEVRAGTALTGFGALTAEEAIYFRSSTDATGAPLEGNTSYEMVIPVEGVPADAFWSLSMYAISPDQRFYFYENELNRYAINSHNNGLIYQPDGSIVLAFQRERPRDATHVWMPTPDVAFKCVFRTYLPQQRVLDELWTPPPITRTG
ncbi:MAG: DUF1254 domain-containing protein [Pseudomonadota bacterium]